MTNKNFVEQRHKMTLVAPRPRTCTGLKKLKHGVSLTFFGEKSRNLKKMTILNNLTVPDKENAIMFYISPR
jgi:hypothetical protein